MVEEKQSTRRKGERDGDEMEGRADENGEVTVKYWKDERERDDCEEIREPMRWMRWRWR